MDNGHKPLPKEIPVFRKPITLEDKLRLIEELCGITAGYPSGTDLLLEDRRIERERELEDGW